MMMIVMIMMVMMMMITMMTTTLCPNLEEIEIIKNLEELTRALQCQYK